MTPPEIRIREYKSADAEAAAKVYKDSVTEISIEQYMMMKKKLSPGEIRKL